MEQARRSSYVFFSFEDRPIFDLDAFLHGKLVVKTSSQVVAYSLLTHSPHVLTRRELEIVAELSAERWVSVSSLGDEAGQQELLNGLVTKGILISDSEAEEHARLRDRETRLAEQQWHPYAALYHFMTRGPDDQADTPLPLVDVEELALLAEENAIKFVERFGSPPDAFHRRPDANAVVELPVIKRNNALYQALDRRKTVRTFDSSRPMDVERLATLLYYVFGCHGYTRFSREVISLRKTSPSGGSLHPIEAYPLVFNVEGLETGLYHYDVERHALELLTELSRTKAEAMAVQMASGQAYVGTAHAIIVMTARFFRSFWKYRRNSRTYGVILKDAGHLSQTFYLVATDLGLASFYTGTINGPKIERVLGLDGFEEGAIGICGCGLELTGGKSLALERYPFEPRRTKI